MKIVHQIGAVIGGLIAGLVVIMAIQAISSLIYPMPPDLDPSDTEALGKWIASLPIGASLFVLVSEALGVLVGTFVARRLAPDRSMIPGLIVFAFFMVATIFNLTLLPHSLWFTIASILSGLVMGLLGLVFAGPKTYIVTSSKTIKAPIEKVFKTLASIDEFSKAVPKIKKVEFLTDTHYGVGTKFRETRMMNDKEASTELEVTELVENKHIRMVSDAGGTVWDTVFEVQQNGDAVQMDMQMDCTPHNFPAKIITPMILGMISKFVEQDMDSIKDYCEQS